MSLLTVEVAMDIGCNTWHLIIVCALQCALKLADVGHLATPPEVHRKWTSKLEAEFFAQGARASSAVFVYFWVFLQQCTQASSRKISSAGSSMHDTYVLKAQSEDNGNEKAFDPPVILR